jgi:signal transduction histidine kinase
MISVRSTIFNFFSLVIIVITLQGNLFAQTKATIQLIDSLNQLSYHLRRNSPKLSLKYAIDAYELSKGTNYSKGFAAAIHNRGTAKAVLGQYDQSLKDLLDAAKIREEINDISGLTSSYNNLGYVFSEMQNDRKALDYYTKSLECHRKSDNAKEIGIVLNNIGWVQLRSKKLDLALEYFYMALKANEQENDERGVGASLSNLGTVYRQMGQYQKGLEYHLKALGIAEKHSDKFGLCNTLFYISEDYFKLKRIEESTVYALKSFILAKDIGMLSDEKKAAALLAQIYESRKKYEESNKYLKLVSSLNDSLFSIEKAETIGKIQSIYEIENRAKENELLRKEQATSNYKIQMQWNLLYISFAFLFLTILLSFFLFSSRKKIAKSIKLLQELNNEINYQKEIIQIKAEALNEKNNELIEINSIKDKLISVIAHDLKSPLHSIAGYAEVLLNRADASIDSEMLSYFRIIHDNAIRGNLLLENLLQWSMFQTHTLQFLPVKQKLAKLITDELYFVQPIAEEKNISIIYNFDSGIEVLADSNMLRTIIRNLISNAIKFSNKGGVVSIEAENTMTDTILTVSDNGIGVNAEIKNKLFTGEVGISSTGTMGEKGTGLGLMLCKDFIEKHSGKIYVETKTHLTRFIVTLPLNPSLE